MLGICLHCMCDTWPNCFPLAEGGPPQGCLRGRGGGAQSITLHVLIMHYAVRVSEVI